jgi:FkbM family methyltransferase
MKSLEARLGGLRALWHFDNRWQLLCNRILFRRTGLTVYRLNGREMLVDHAAGDECGTRVCIVTRMYRRYLPLMSFSGPINVLDLGANGGGFGLMLVAGNVSVQKIVCVELNPQTCMRAQFNMARNISGETKVINAAVCGERRDFELWLGPGGTSNSIYQSGDSPAQGRSKVSVRGITLDDIGRTEFPEPEVIHLCKMDIEGAEYEVLSSRTHGLLRRVRYLVIEVHPNPTHTLAEFFEKLAGVGFEEVPCAEAGIKGVHLFKNARPFVA